MIVRFDSLFNTYPSQLSGNLTYDLNANCAANSTDLPFQNKVTTFTNTTGQQWYGLSDAAGHYQRSLPYGDFNITTTPEPNKQVNCPAAGTYSVVISAPGEQGGNDFYESLIPGLINLSVSAVPATFVPGFDATPHFLVKNNGSQPFSGELKIIGDPVVDYVSSTPAGTLSGDTVSISISALQPDSTLSVAVTWNVPAGTALSTVLQFGAHVPAAGDAYPGDNDDTLAATVVGAFDPNDKAVNRSLHFAGDRELVYKVQFQNTGTYPAKNVLVLDSMDSHLDFSTFKLLESSHPGLKITWNPGGRVFFNYPDIYLPDSNANEPGSHGYFTYSIRVKDDAQVGDTVLNTAYIYFDYNAPVVTNTTMNILSAAPGAVGAVAGEAAVSIAPNPTDGVVYCMLPPGQWTATLTDMTGRVLHGWDVSGGGSSKALRLGMPPGVYLLRFANAAGQPVVRKVVVR